jgi:hypothetical protein
MAREGKKQTESVHQNREKLWVQAQGGAGASANTVTGATDPLCMLIFIASAMSPATPLGGFSNARSDILALLS